MNIWPSRFNRWEKISRKSFRNVNRNLVLTGTVAGEILVAGKISKLGHLEGKASTSNGKRRWSLNWGRSSKKLKTQSRQWRMKHTGGWRKPQVLRLSVSSLKPSLSSHRLQATLKCLRNLRKLDLTPQYSSISITPPSNSLQVQHSPIRCATTTLTL